MRSQPTRFYWRFTDKDLRESVSNRSCRTLTGRPRSPEISSTISTISSYFQAFLASQVATGAGGFLSKSVTVAAMHQQSGDIHHIVSKNYLQKHGFPDCRDYNQVAILR